MTNYSKICEELPAVLPFVSPSAHLNILDQKDFCGVMVGFVWCLYP